MENVIDEKSLDTGIANGKGDPLIVSASNFKGVDYLSIRYWYHAADDGKLLPSKNGLSIKISELDNLIQSLTEFKDRI